MVHLRSGVFFSNGSTSRRVSLTKRELMASMSFKFTMEEKKPIFSTAGDTMAPIAETYTPQNRSGSEGSESVFSPLAPSFHSRNGSDLNNLLNLNPQEPRIADTAPTSIDIDDMLMNLRMNGSEIQFDDVDQNSHSNYFMGENAQAMGGRPESVSSNIWGDGSSSSSSSAARTGEMIDTFDFFVKSLSSANNYVSMLTREQLSVLRSIRPSLLYEFLQEVVKVRSDKRMRRALPNECAFCKNNGENEECYSSHALKDWRGRVLCPVLRAFRCPRCGATGDRAHTIKYCPENSEGGLERSGSFASRRRAPSSSLLIGQQPPGPAPAPSPSPSAGSMSHSSLWNTFGMN